MQDAPDTQQRAQGSGNGDSALGPAPHHSIYGKWGFLKGLRRRLVAPVYRLSDTGLFGLTPLRTHILVCGYQRAGTTMLLAMLEYAHPKARRFGEETSGWRAATYAWRNHAVVVSKVPKDIFELDALQAFYAARKAKLRIIIMVRDPRDVLTSKMKGAGYGADIPGWRDYHEHYRRHKTAPNAILVRYEDLVADPAAAQRKIDAFTGEPSERPFAEFHTEERKDFDTFPLNGVRPVDQNTVGRWGRPEHRERLEQVLREVPDFPQILIELGYEKDDTWIERWRAGTQSPAT
jgi:hypothetical protein